MGRANPELVDRVGRLIAGGPKARPPLIAIVGYGVRRPCYHGHKIAPLFAASPDIAAALLHSLRSTVPAEEAFFIDVPQPNQLAVALAAASGMIPVFKTARMYRGPAPELPLSCLYGITSFELG